jgi:hypothetical protein
MDRYEIHRSRRGRPLGIALGRLRRHFAVDRLRLILRRLCRSLIGSLVRSWCRLTAAFSVRRRRVFVAQRHAIVQADHHHDRVRLLVRKRVFDGRRPIERFGPTGYG